MTVKEAFAERIEMATTADYRAWLEAYLAGGGKITHVYNRTNNGMWYRVVQDTKIPDLHGANSYNLFVPSDVTIESAGGHNDLFAEGGSIHPKNPGLDWAPLYAEDMKDLAQEYPEAIEDAYNVCKKTLPRCEGCDEDFSMHGEEAAEMHAENHERDTGHTVALIECLVTEDSGEFLAEL